MLTNTKNSMYFILCLLLLSILVLGIIMIKTSPGLKKNITKNVSLSILLVTVVFIIFYWHENLLYMANYYKTKSGGDIFLMHSIMDSCKYGIMFDAGSTGSRVHVFKFKTYNNDSLILEGSFFQGIKPGLSSYADSPKLAAKSLEPLLEHAKSYIPKEHWSSTPLALRATAGLRLLSQKTSDEILSEVTSLFARYPFDLSQGGVSIMEGVDEGLFSWFTVNFLNDNFKRASSQTVGVLDLGGGSTQITFIPKIVKQKHPFLVDRKLFNEHLKIYTHSYLGLGMMSARFQIMGGIERVTGHIPSHNLESFCLPPSWNGTWEYRREVHNLKSLSSPTTKNRWFLCNNEAKKLINKYNIDKSLKLQDSNFYAISFFYDQLELLKVPKDPEGGYNVTISTYIELAENVCKSGDTSKPFECLDLCYASSLLTEGYNFSSSKLLTVKKKIRSYEIAWPLGAMFEVYDQFSTISPEYLPSISTKHTIHNSSSSVAILPPLSLKTR